MSEVKKHIHQAERNEKFFDDVKNEYTDWAVTGLFYAALHLVEAFLSLKNQRAEDHKTRSWYISTIKELKPIYEDYRALYDYSVNARYKMLPLSLESLNDIYAEFFSNIKKTMLRHLKASK